MKRYDLELMQQPTLDGSDTYYEMEEAKDGNWYKREDVIDFLKTIDDIDWEAVLAEGEL